MRSHPAAATLFSIVTILLLAACAAPVEPEPTPVDESRVVQEDVRKLANAVFESDVDTAFSFTHPRIVELMGGEASARQIMEAGFAQINSMEMQLESLTFPREPDFVSGDENEYVIVHTETVMAVNEQRVRVLNFQFGIRPKGETDWTYIEGSRMDPEILGQLFPDFPPGYALPQVTQERI